MDKDFYVDEFGRDTKLCSAFKNGVDDEPCFENECENCPYYNAERG